MGAEAVYLCNVFLGAHAVGNATGVVLEPSPLGAERRLEIAQALRAPDTVFVCHGHDGVQVVFYSPREGEMAFCGQGVLAAAAVLAALQRQAPSGGLRTAVGAVHTETDASGRCWFSQPATAVRRCDSEARWEALGTGLPGREQAVVDSGRARLFVEVDDPDSVRLSPAVVKSFCVAHGLTGICVYRQRTDRSVRLRVFTVSLGGEEDFATGGAVLGLSRLLAPAADPIVVLQGDAGDRFRAGELTLRHRPSEPTVAVGGRVQLVSRGELLL